VPDKFTALTPELHRYIVEHGARRDEAQLAVERETDAMGEIAVMQTAPDQAALITLLVKAIGARRALEVGTFTGYGAIAIARGLADGGRLSCLELSPEFADIAQRNLLAAGVADRVDIVIGPADESLRAMPEEPTFDFVYLDADKRAYPTYYDLIVPRLLPGGLLLIDNVLLGGDVVDPQDDRARIVDDLNTRITADDRVDSVMVLVADGLTLARRR
jgi:caffeoyl-CoA O-methyltransferase